MSLPTWSLLLATFLPVVSAGPLIVAHRGASSDAPENTLPAFQLAWQQGADAIEGDFHLTRDRQVVCIHDKDTKRVAQRTLKVAASTLAELQRLDVGSWKDRRWVGTRIPTLPEVLATVPAGKRIFIEIKSGPAIIAPLLADLARSSLGDEQVVLIAFDADLVRMVKAKAPRFTANWLFSFKDRGGRRPAEAWPKILATLEVTGADGLGSNDHPALTPALLSGLHAAGFAHHIWTVDDPATARRFLAMGSRSVTTNQPGALRRALEAAP